MSNEESVRLDVWLDVACIFKTRSQAQTACRRGRVEVNGDHGKPHRAVRPGDTIRIKMPGGHRRIIEVLGDPHDIAKTALFLIKDATYMSGQVLTVDGGRSLNS